MYRLNGDGEVYGVIRISDWVLIMPDPQDQNWLDYQDWISQGNKPLEPLRYLLVFELDIDGIIRINDGEAIAEIAEDPDWVEYLNWKSLGNSPEPAYGYRLIGNDESKGVRRLDNKDIIPYSPDSVAWKIYESWKSFGLSPIENMGQDRKDLIEKDQRQKQREKLLSEDLINYIDFMINIWEIGRTNNVWNSGDLPNEIRSKIAAWQQIISDYRGEEPS